METRPAFQVDENGDLIITSRYGVKFNIIEVLNDEEKTSTIRIRKYGTITEKLFKEHDMNGGRAPKA